MPENGYQNRVTKLAFVPAHQLLANPDNARQHPAAQREALRGSLATLGWAAPVIVNERTGYLLDGHARVEEALTVDEHAEIPVAYVDLDEAEEAQFLVSFDWITTLATYDRDQTEALLQRVQSDDERVQAMVADMAEVFTVPEGDVWGDAFGALPESDRSPFQQMTFTLHDTQVETIREAMKLAASLGPYGDTGNENGNGNALARICEVFITNNG